MINKTTGKSVSVKSHLLMLQYTNHHYWAAGSLPAIFLMLLISLGRLLWPKLTPPEIVPSPFPMSKQYLKQSSNASRQHNAQRRSVNLCLNLLNGPFKIDNNLPSATFCSETHLSLSHCMSIPKISFRESIHFRRQRWKRVDQVDIIVL